MFPLKNGTVGFSILDVSYCVTSLRFVFCCMFVILFRVVFIHAVLSTGRLSLESASRSQLFSGEGSSVYSGSLVEFLLLGPRCPLVPLLL